MERDVEERFQRIEKLVESLAEEQRVFERSTRRMFSGGLRILAELQEHVVKIDENMEALDKQIKSLAGMHQQTEVKFQAFLDSLRKPSSN